MLLVGDIGGTKTELALVKQPRTLSAKETFPSQHYQSLNEIITQYIQKHNPKLTHAVFGVAGPIYNQSCKITNLPWEINAAHITQAFHLTKTWLINDLQAIAESIDILSHNDFLIINEGKKDPSGVRAIVAPGTGLGQAFMTQTANGHISHPSEGGHTDFAPSNQEEIELLQYLWGKYDHVSYERICSGIGIPNIFSFYTDVKKYEISEQLAVALKQTTDTTKVIVQDALLPDSACQASLATCECFFSILAREASNCGIKYFATGGIFIGGGLPRRMQPLINSQNFMEHFLNKGRFKAIVQQFPLAIITNQDTALLGAANYGIKMK